MDIFVPAQPGFYAKWKCEGAVRHDHIIAWAFNSSSPTLKPTPIGVHGICDDNAEIVGPDGRVIEE
jgi:hypothetical protein